MNFLEFFDDLVLEKQLSYNIPDDKEKLMYDFYTLSYLSQFNLLGNVGPKVSGVGEIMDTSTMRRQLDLDTIENFSDIKKTILQYLKKHMLKAVVFAISAEFRHIFVNNDPAKLIDFFEKRGGESFIREYALNYKALNTNFGDFLKVKNKHRLQRFEQDQRGYLDSYTAITQTDISSSKFVKLAEESFNNLTWSQSYGGKAWANICSGWMRLHNAENENALFVAIDHIYDLQHNTDTVFNKLKSYYKNGGYSWIKVALDHKANLKNPYDLLEKSSGTIRILAKKILKSEGFEGWEDYLRSKGILPRKPTSLSAKPMTEWKEGDIIKVADITMNQTSPRWKYYIGKNIEIIKILPKEDWFNQYKMTILVKNPLSGNDTEVYAERFEWVSEGKDKPSEKKDPSTWKVGDIVKAKPDIKSQYLSNFTDGHKITKIYKHGSTTYMNVAELDGSDEYYHIAADNFELVRQKTPDSKKDKPWSAWKKGDFIKMKDGYAFPKQEFKITDIWDSSYDDSEKFIDAVSVTANHALDSAPSSMFDWIEKPSINNKHDNDSHFNWKVGDIVECVDNNGVPHILTVGNKYTISSIIDTSTPHVYLKVINDYGKSTIVKASRFKKVSSAKAEPFKARKVKIKVGDIVKPATHADAATLDISLDDTFIITDIDKQGFLTVKHQQSGKTFVGWGDWRFVKVEDNDNESEKENPQYNIGDVFVDKDDIAVKNSMVFRIDGITPDKKYSAIVLNADGSKVTEYEKLSAEWIKFHLRPAPHDHDYFKI